MKIMPQHNEKNFWMDFIYLFRGERLAKDILLDGKCENKAP
jgi:hypothetical protein